MPKLVEAFGTFGVTQALHVWKREDGHGLMIGCPSYEHGRGGAFVAFSNSQGEEVMALARALAEWALQHGAQRVAKDDEWFPGGGE